MRSLIPIHEVSLYLPLLFFLFCSGSYALAPLLHRKIFSHFSFNHLQTNNVWHLFLILLGFTFINLKNLLSYDPIKLLLFFALALPTAYLFLKIEVKLNRVLFRRGQFSHNAVKNKAPPSEKTELSDAALALLGHKAKKKETRKKLKNRSTKFSDTSFRLQDLLVCAIVEELVYRGYFLTLLTSVFPSYLHFLAILFTSIFFGLIHFSFGWHQWLCKMLMGSLFSVFVLLTHSLFPAIFSHLCFNFLVYHYREKREHSLSEATS